MWAEFQFYAYVISISFRYLINHLHIYSIFSINVGFETIIKTLNISIKINRFQIKMIIIGCATKKPFNLQSTCCKAAKLQFNWKWFFAIGSGYRMLFLGFLFLCSLHHQSSTAKLHSSIFIPYSSLLCTRVCYIRLCDGNMQELGLSGQ